MLKLLVVEDSPLILNILKRVFSHHSATMDVTFCSTMEETALLLDLASNYFDAALVDLCLPDAPHGEIVQYLLDRKIVTVVLTSKEDEKLRNTLLDQGVLDYILKSNRKALNYALKLIHNLKSNAVRKILVVEDSKVTAKHIYNALASHGYQLFFVETGKEALCLIGSATQHFDIVLVDYNLPDMNGLKLIDQIDAWALELPPLILGMSSDLSGSLSSAFIKYGGDDFLRKPFTPEELAARLMKMLERQALTISLRQAAFQDPLTKISNRHAAYDFVAKQKDKPKPVHICLLDLDHFKSINDTYGHAIGDAVLSAFANELVYCFQGHFFARFGGEEFIVIADCDIKTLLDSFTQLYQRCLQATQSLQLQHPISFSGGITNNLLSAFQQGCHEADMLLYEAKKAGRKRLFYQASEVHLLDPNQPE